MSENEELEQDTNDNAGVSISFLPKKTFVFVIWNTKEKRDDKFTIEQTSLPRDTDEKLEQMARFKLRGIISDKDCYDNQKIRKDGEPK